MTKKYPKTIKTHRKRFKQKQIIWKAMKKININVK